MNAPDADRMSAWRDEVVEALVADAWEGHDEPITLGDLEAMADALLPLLARIDREARGEAWDEGANAAVTPVLAGSRMSLAAVIPFPDNPYRADTTTEETRGLDPESRHR